MGEISPKEILFGIMDVVAELKQITPDWDRFCDGITPRQERALRIIVGLTKDFGNE